MNDQSAEGKDNNAVVAEIRATREEVGIAILVAAPQAPKSKTILVVDDELYLLKKAHVRNYAENFYDTIVDVTDPRFSDLWVVAKAVPGLGAIEWDQEAAAAYFASDDAVASVLLSQEFLQLAQAPLKQLLAPFSARAVWVEKLKTVFKDAFPSPEFDLKFIAAPRPKFGELSECAAVFLDLFLEQGEHSPVDSVQAYLRQLALDAREAMLPPLVLMSSHPELEQHKLGFSARSEISAAGLMVLPKNELMQPEFSATGLRLAFQLLDRQKNVAHAMRVFMAAWLKALDQAKKNAARTLWNLDASAMQQIHLTSINDHDPYDEHLNELLSREHLFHVEADGGVALSVVELDKQFRAQLSLSGQIENRLMSPLVDVKAARAFVSHFTWFGSALPANFMDDDAHAAARISRSLPFGSVLGLNEVSDGSTCLVHITQQCDLNAISRDEDASRTLTFATMEAIELQASSNPIAKNTELIAKGLRIRRGAEEREFDLRLKVGTLLAMPLREFLSRTRVDEWRVIGRLRSDITNHIVAATTNHMSRPASQKMIRPAQVRAKVFLQSAKLTGKQIYLPVKDSQEKRLPAKVFSLSLEDDRYSFEDNASIEIALWLTFNSATIGLSLDPNDISSVLRRGWKSSDQLASGLNIRVRPCEDLSKSYKAIVGGDIGGVGAQLTVISGK